MGKLSDAAAAVVRGTYAAEDAAELPRDSGYTHSGVVAAFSSILLIVLVLSLVVNELCRRRRGAAGYDELIDAKGRPHGMPYPEIIEPYMSRSADGRAVMI